MIILVSTELKEIKKSLLKADEEVEDKIAKEGGDAESHQKGHGCQKRDKWRTSRRKKVEDIDMMMMMIMLMKISKSHIAIKKDIKFSSYSVSLKDASEVSPLLAL